MREAGVEAGAIGGVGGLRELPRSAGLDVGVHRADEDPQGFEGVADLVVGERLRVFLHAVVPEATEVLFEFLVGGRGRDSAGVVAAHHVEQAIDEVAEVVTEVGFVAVLERQRREVRVLTDDHLTTEVETKGVGPVRSDETKGVGGVAGGLRSLLVVDRPPAVDEQLARGLDAEGLEHAGPVDRVGRREDVFADDVDVRGPEAFVCDGRVVVGQGVEPDVGDERLIKGQFDAPGQTGLRTRDAQVVHRLLQELEDLVLAEARRDEVRVRAEVLDQPGLELRQLEIVVLFGRLGDLAVDLRPGAVRRPILVREELFLPGRIPVGLLAFVDEALVEKLLEELLDDLLVPRFGRTDIVVVRDIEVAQHALEDCGDLIDQDLRFDAALERRLLDLLAMFVEPGQEVDRASAHAHVAGDHVGEDFLVGMAEVRRAVGVVDGRGDVERTGHEELP